MGGEGPIPFTAIDRFACRYGINDIDEFDNFLFVIRSMDAEYRTTMAERAERARQLNEEFRKKEKPPKQAPKLLTGERGGED